MKPKQAKAICEVKVQVDPDCPALSPISEDFKYGLRNTNNPWKCLRIAIESIECAGFKVSITKDGKEYNR